MTAARSRSGRIISFYSYKGGTGRSMAVANIAWILASNGFRVLIIDWDVEAPGLHRYLHPFLLDPELVASDGIIDWATNFVLEAMTLPAGDPDPDWFRPLADLSRYAVSADWHGFRGDATLDLVPAGRQGPDYAAKVNGFDWHGFYERFGGGAFLEEARQRLRASYDYVLIDSRTGVSDTSGICTVALPDSLAVCFTLNGQSIEGAAAVAESVLQSRGESGFAVFPVPMRVELGEKDRLDQARDHAHSRFERFLLSKDRAERQRYWGEVEVLYEPYYAYEEVLAVFRDRPGQTASVLGALERLTNHLTDGRVGQLVPPSEAERVGALQRYLSHAVGSAVPAVGSPVGRYAFISYSALDGSEFASRLATAMETAEPPVTTWVAARDLQTGSGRQEQLDQAIRSSGVVLQVVSSGSSASSSSVALEVDTARRLGKPIIALRINREATIPGDTPEANLVDFSSDFDLGVASLLMAMRRLESPQGRLTTLVRRRRDAERDVDLTSTPGGRKLLEQEIQRLDAEIRELADSIARQSPDAAPVRRTFRVTVASGRVTGTAEDRVVSGRVELDDLGSRTVEFMRSQMRSGRLWPQDLELLGSHLYRVLFNADVGLAFESTLRTLLPSEKLRLELEVADLDLPWEVLYIPERLGRAGFFAGTHEQLVLVRGVSDQRLSPPPRASGPLRLLLAETPSSATPSVAEMLPPVPGLELTQVGDLTPSNLLRSLRDGADILHLRVHASAEKLVLGTTLIEIPTLAQQLRSDEPRLVFIHSPNAESTEEAQALGRMSATLLRYGVYSVVSVAEPLFSANGLRGFINTFYRALATGSAVDEAAQRARGEVGLLAADVPAQLAEIGSFRVYCAGPEPAVMASEELRTQGPQPAAVHSRS